MLNHVYMENHTFSSLLFIICHLEFFPPFFSVSDINASLYAPNFTVGRKIVFKILYSCISSTSTIHLRGQSIGKTSH